MDKVQTTPDYPRGITFEEVWAALKETDRMMKENEAKREKEFDRMDKENAERKKEIDRIEKENAKREKEFDRMMKEAERQRKEFNKRFGDFSSRLGDIAESMVAPNLVKRFFEIGIEFNEALPNKVISNHKGKIFFEVDFFLENDKNAMLVEVKTKLETKDVKDHIQRLEKMRIYADLRGDKRTFMGAVAGVVITKDAKAYALEQGLYVLKPSGETFKITSPEGKAKEW